MRQPHVCDRPRCTNEVHDAGPPEGRDRLGVTVRGGAKALEGKTHHIRHVHLDICEPCRGELHDWFQFS